MLLFYSLHIDDLSTRYTYIFRRTIVTVVGSSSSGSVGIVTSYELDDPGIESRCRRDFPYLSRPALGTTHSPVQWVPGFSRG